MLKGALILLIGGLIGANAVYYVMTRRQPEACAPLEPVAPSPVLSAPPAAITPAAAIAKPAAVASNSAPPSAPAMTLPAAVPAPSGLIVPVSGIRADQLLNTFDDARGGERVHEALDIMAAAGTPVVAVADGQIEKLFTSDAGGLTIYQFEPSGRLAYYYAHLQAYAPGLHEKQAVKQGELIGYVGSTGNASPEAPHLHFAVFELGPEKQWWKGTPRNPYPLLGGK